MQGGTARSQTEDGVVTAGTCRESFLAAAAMLSGVHFVIALTADLALSLAVD